MYKYAVIFEAYDYSIQTSCSTNRIYLPTKLSFDFAHYTVQHSLKILYVLEQPIHDTTANHFAEYSVHVVSEVCHGRHCMKADLVEWMKQFFAYRSWYISLGFLPPITHFAVPYYSTSILSTKILAHPSGTYYFQIIELISRITTMSPISLHGVCTGWIPIYAPEQVTCEVWWMKMLTKHRSDLPRIDISIKQYCSFVEAFQKYSASFSNGW